MSSLRRCHEMVWCFRGKYHTYWPTPDVVDSLRYALTEIGEAMSDWLRENRTDHKRNHQHETDIVGELADCAIMLLTAIEKWDDDLLSLISPDEMSLEDIALNVAAAMNKCKRYYQLLPRALIMCALGGIESYLNGQLEEAIASRLERIKQKHVDPYLEG